MHEIQGEFSHYQQISPYLTPEQPAIQSKKQTLLCISVPVLKLFPLEQPAVPAPTHVVRKR